METKEHGLYFAIRELHTFSERRGMLELRLRVLSFITDYLNQAWRQRHVCLHVFTRCMFLTRAQVNTQAMLVAGCAMSLLISSELTGVSFSAAAGPRCPTPPVLQLPARLAGPPHATSGRGGGKRARRVV